MNLIDRYKELLSQGSKTLSNVLSAAKPVVNQAASSYVNLAKKAYPIATAPIAPIEQLRKLPDLTLTPPKLGILQPKQALTQAAKVPPYFVTSLLKSYGESAYKLRRPEEFKKASTLEKIGTVADLADFSPLGATVGLAVSKLTKAARAAKALKYEDEILKAANGLQYYENFNSQPWIQIEKIKRIQRLLDEVMPELNNKSKFSREFRRLGSRDPTAWMKTATELLKEQVVAAHNPKMDLGFSVKTVNRGGLAKRLGATEKSILPRIGQITEIEREIDFLIGHKPSGNWKMDYHAREELLGGAKEAAPPDVVRKIEKLESTLEALKSNRGAYQQIISQTKNMAKLKTLKEVPSLTKAGEITEPARLVRSLVQDTSVPKVKIPTQKLTTPLEQASSQQLRVQAGSKPLADIVNSSEINVKQKVGLLDYLRTPDRVLKKIGMENEAKLIRQKYDDYLKQLPDEINKITKWSKQVPTESNQRIFKYLDGQSIELNPQEMRVATEIKDYLKDWAGKLKLPADKQISHYITHIFEKDFIQKEFDPDVAKLIQDRVAGSVYDPFLEQRLGKMGYVEDTWRALDAYVKRATRKFNMDEALTQVKDKASNLETSQYNYVKKYIDRINLRPTEIDNLLDNSIKQIVGYKYGGRPVAYLTRSLRQMVYRGTLGLNVGSAMKNLTQGANTYAKLGEKYTTIGYIKNLMKMATGDNELQRVGVLRDNFIQDRTISATKKFWETTDKGLFFFFETAEKINRGSAYFGAKAKALAEGMNEQQAIEFAKKIVRDTQFTFGSVDTPPVLSSDMAKLIGQFQSYTLKQGEFLADMVKNKEFMGMARYAFASFVMASTVGKLIGMEWKDFIPSIRIGLPPTMQGPYEIGRAVVGAPDQYGNVPDMTERVEKGGESFIPFIPGGTQIKKSIQGLETVGKGYSESKTGRVRSPVEQNLTNKVRGGLFGQYNLPEIREYYDKGLSVLGEKQSEIFKQLSPEERKKYYELIQQKRGLNKEEQSGLLDTAGAAESSAIQDMRVEVARERIKLNGGSTWVGNNFVYKDDSGTHVIDASLKPTEPKLTGNETLDAKLISAYKSQLAARANDIAKLYELGQLSAAKAEDELKKIEELKTVYTKPKKVRVKKLAIPKLKAVKLPKIKKYKAAKIKTVKVKRYALKKVSLKRINAAKVRLTSKA
jgi:hypothetical protein